MAEGGFLNGRGRGLKYFCHNCDLEVVSNSEGFTCPVCGAGFIEQLPDESADSVTYDLNNDFTTEMMITRTLLQGIFHNSSPLSPRQQGIDNDSTLPTAHLSPAIPSLFTLPNVAPVFSPLPAGTLSSSAVLHPDSRSPTPPLTSPVLSRSLRTSLLLCSGPIQHLPVQTSSTHISSSFTPSSTLENLVSRNSTHVAGANLQNSALTSPRSTYQTMTSHNLSLAPNPNQQTLDNSSHHDLTLQFLNRLPFMPTRYQPTTNTRISSPHPPSDGSSQLQSGFRLPVGSQLLTHSQLPSDLPGGCQLPTGTERVSVEENVSENTVRQTVSTPRSTTVSTPRSTVVSTVPRLLPALGLSQQLFQHMLSRAGGIGGSVFMPNGNNSMQLNNGVAGVRMRNHLLDLRGSFHAFDEVLTQLMNQVNPGPLPASASQITALPTVNITAEHLRRSSQCAICMEDFNLDESVRCLPCHHVYHNECIVRWLELHGTCPVCRTSVSDSSRQYRQLSVDTNVSLTVDQLTLPAAGLDVNNNDNQHHSHQQQQQQQYEDDPVTSILDEVNGSLLFQSSSLTDCVDELPVVITPDDD